ncbi:MAG: hypothetical protein WA946_05795 [Nitrospirota bacterium]
MTEAAGVKKDFVSIVSPGIEMVDRTGRLDTDLSAQLDRLDYSKHRDLSATNMTYGGKFAYRATPLLNISAGGGYSINSNPTLDPGMAGPGIQPGTIITTPSNQPGDTQMPPPSSSSSSTSSNPPGTGPSYNLPAGAPLPVVSLSQKRLTASLSADYMFTEKTSAMTSYTYGTTSYERPSYRDTSHDVNAGLVYDFGTYLSTLKGRLNAGYSAYYVTDARTESITCTVGFSRDFDEFWSVLVDGGLRRTWSEIFVTGLVQETPTTQMAVRERQDNRGWGWVTRLSLNYRGERMQEEFAYIRDLSLAAGLNGAAERNSLSLTTRYRLTYEVSALLSTSYSTYKADPSNYSAQVIDQRPFDISAGIRFEFSKDTALDVSYDYTLVRYPASDANARRQLVFIGLSAQFPFWE